MKRVTFIALIALFVAASHFAQSSENDAVRVPLDNYLKAHATGDGGYHKKAFHTEGNLIFVRDGKFTTRSFAEYIAGSSGKPAADEDKRKRWIEMVHVSGNAAVGKIILDYPSTYFVDYFALLKIDGEWKIVNKSFHAQPRAELEKLKTANLEEEKKAIAVPLQTYLRVGETYDGKLFHQAFRPEAKIISIANGRVDQKSVADYAALYNGKPDDDAKPMTSFEVLDVFGNAAIAKVNLEFPGVRFVDYMTLLKIDGEWKIVNKTFSSESKRPAKV